jgi:glutaminase
MNTISRVRRSNLRKYKLNYSSANYNSKTGFFDNRIHTYSTTYNQLGIKHYECEKCKDLFSTLKQLRQHKEEHHAY